MPNLDPTDSSILGLLRTRGRSWFPDIATLRSHIPKDELYARLMRLHAMKLIDCDDGMVAGDDNHETLEVWLRSA